MDAPLSLSPEVISTLRSRHVAYLMTRLVDESARGDFLRSFEAGYDHAMARPLREWLTPRQLVDQASGVLTERVVRGLLAPLAREASRRSVHSLRSDDALLGDYVPSEARARIAELLARGEFIPNELVRRLIDSDAVDEILRDVLYDALVEFNQSVNPFFSEWGLPALIKKVVPIGASTILKSMATVRAEFDKRLEPEMRRFLLGFSRKAKRKLLQLAESSHDDPKLVELRKAVASFVYEQTLADLTKHIDDDARMEIDEAAEAIVLEVLRNERPRERLIAELERWLAEYGEEPLGAWLRRIGVTERPDFEAIAELLWPYVKFALESPPSRAFFERITWDFYASLASS
jgi:hypothetical protein